jgi:hypothetical protein
MKARVALLAIGTVVVAAIVAVALALFRNHGRNSAFDAVTKGMSEEQVLVLMGRPDARRQVCRDAPSWIGDPVHEQQCSFEYQYDAWFEPQFWTVGFGADGRAISKYNYVSP